jgi:hypothetical protein
MIRKGKQFLPIAIHLYVSIIKSGRTLIRRRAKDLKQPQILSSPPVFSGVRITRSLGLYACFVDRCLSFCTFSFGHCAVCSSSMPWFYCSKVNVLENGHKEPFKKTLYTLVRNEDFYKNPWEWYIEDSAVCSSSVYGFWLPLWYLQTLLLF